MASKKVLSTIHFTLLFYLTFPGDLGVRGVRAVVPLASWSAMADPKMADSVAASGGGMGYMPRLISTKERPKDQTSLATEYWEP